MKTIIKSKLKNLIELLPRGKDLYLHLFRNRLEISYRGVFPNYQECLAHADADLHEYDVVNQNKANAQKEEEEILDNYFRYYDYPVLFWLEKALAETPRVLEIGGSVGHFYYSSKKFISHPQNLLWIIAELPEAVSLGRKIAEKRQEKPLQFLESNRIDHNLEVDCIVAGGSLQYMETEVKEMLKSLRQLPKHLLFNSLPTTAEKSFWTLQNLEICEVPYRVFSPKDLISDLSALGYSLIDEWHRPRKLEIPFHPEAKVDYYSGYYFKKKQLP
jgi:putative methyltransferase (TIGR04325 family)